MRTYGVAPLPIGTSHEAALKAADNAATHSYGLVYTLRGYGIRCLLNEIDLVKGLLDPQMTAVVGKMLMAADRDELRHCIIQKVPVFLDRTSLVTLLQQEHNWGVRPGSFDQRNGAPSRYDLHVYYFDDPSSFLQE